MKNLFYWIGAISGLAAGVPAATIAIVDGTTAPAIYLFMVQLMLICYFADCILNHRPSAFYWVNVIGIGLNYIPLLVAIDATQSVTLVCFGTWVGFVLIAIIRTK